MLNSIKTFSKLLSPRFQKLILEYRVDLKPRYGPGSQAPHPRLLEIISANKDQYRSTLGGFLNFKKVFNTIKPSNEEKDANEPSWNNGFLPGLDIITLYSMIATNKPKHYIEVGSGNSTKVVRKAIKDQNLTTRIISIDPFPRTTIDHLSDEVIRQPIEAIDHINYLVNELDKNDILFIDNSHRCLPNSDVTTCFLDILPYLKKGVLVHVHDIYLPYDYPQFMCDRGYSEQYVLAAFILANPDKYKPIFPCFFVSEDPELAEIISPLWESPNTRNVEKHGGSFWLQIN